MFARIAGMGQWFPERIRHNAEWPAAFTAARQQRQGDRMLVDVPADTARDPSLRIVKRYLVEEDGDPFLGTRERRVADGEAVIMTQKGYIMFGRRQAA